MEADPTTARTELDARKAWTLARIGELVNAGRALGWLHGPALSAVPDASAIRSVAIDAQPLESPMRTLAARLQLSQVEMDVLWLLVCVEVEPALSNAAQLLVSPGMHELNAQIVDRLVGDDRASNGDTLDRLARLGLIETPNDRRTALYRRAVRVNDRVIDLAHGRLDLDRGLAEFATLTSALDTRRAIHGLAITIPAELGHVVGAASKTLVVATGVEGSGRSTLLRHAISSSGRSILAVQAERLATDPDNLPRNLRAIARECTLHDAWPLIIGLDALSEFADVVDRELFHVHAQPVLATARDTWTRSHSRPVVTISLGQPDEAARIELWRNALPGVQADVTADCGRRYSISPGLIQRTATAARAATRGAIEVDDVHAALRGQVERGLLGLATRIEIHQSWDDLVLPVDQFDLLIELVGRVRHRRQVLDTWGFGAKVGRGLGTAALLSGAPGTGKTMIAGLVARELGLDLYQVDLSRVVSKYIGETEKQLARLFEAAESGHAILLFDEADSLFGKRTEVSSSNDRYANLEVNYLLQRIEAYSGIALLTTNHETAIDPAFLRRLAFHVRVPMPDGQQRAMLWRSMIPDRAARDADLAFDALATDFVMSGGYIKNAVVRAAFYAADEGNPISQTHLLRAAWAEYEAIGKIALSNGSR